MKTVKALIFTYGMVFSSTGYSSNINPTEERHPCIYVSNSDKEKIVTRIATQKWAAKSFEAIKNQIRPYVERHQTDPQWIVSRLAMYWKNGEHYTQCYLHDQNWDYGEGNAPVPTVRMPGMRTWNKYVNIPLEKRTPYNESGEMWGIDRTNPTAKPVLVPYKESGHMIRSNNSEILSLAQNAAFIYWINGDVRYARFAADIFYKWLAGTYYMNPILDPEHSTGSGGGFEPGGICGYYDYEQIHDNLVTLAAPIYDFLYDYLCKNPNSQIKAIGKSTEEVTTEVFKRFINLGMIRGGRTGNWNVNCWNVLMPAIVTLNDNKTYSDGKGREYYIDLFMKTSTKYHEALPDILANYDKITGLWNESPGYSFGTISQLLDFSTMLQNIGIDLIDKYPIMRKAASAILPWLDEKGNIVVFGDTRGGTPDFKIFERLLAYYTMHGDKSSAESVGAILKKEIDNDSYSRNRSDWQGICTFTDSIPTGSYTQSIQTAYSPQHRHITLKNFNGNFKLMATIYGGRRDYHLSPNGLAAQFYGYGYALAPDASGYESYWTADTSYHQSATGSNTIIPGYKEGDISVNALYPPIHSGEFTATGRDSDSITFADVSASEKRRIIALVRTSEDSGYYLDIFLSEQPENDYIFHNVGKSLQLFDYNMNLLNSKEVNDISKRRSKGYDYFTRPKMISVSNDFIARWIVDKNIICDFHHVVISPCEVYCVEAPYTTLNAKLTPNGISAAPSQTPTLIIRKTGAEPFVGVYEAHRGNPSIKSVNGSIHGENINIAIQLKNGKTDYVTFSPDKGLIMNRKI
jgi:hypothetical protein